MNSRKKLIAGGVVAGGLMLGAAGLVIGAGIAKADPSPTVTTTAPAPGWSERDIQRAICNNSYWRHQYAGDCIERGL